MGKLVKASKWVNENFERGSRPSLIRVGQWIRDGQVPGRIIGGIIYIDADEFTFNVNTKPEPLTAEKLLH